MNFTMIKWKALKSQEVSYFEGSQARSIRRFYLITLMAVLGLIFSCDLPHQPGPMPTDIVETEFEPGLNILGVLRADELQGNSFININRALTTEEIYSDTIDNFIPEVDHVIVSSSSNTYPFTRSNINPNDWEDYTNASLHATPDETYELEISAPGFPLVTAETTIPRYPWILKSSWVFDAGEVKFDILHHASAYEYKIYLYFAGSVLEKVVKPGNTETIQVEWNYSESLGEPVSLTITALDENLTRYGNSPISFIPNTYHPDASTVEGGYGCFGSVSVSEYDLPVPATP